MELSKLVIPKMAKRKSAVDECRPVFSADAPKVQVGFGPIKFRTSHNLLSEV